VKGRVSRDRTFRETVYYCSGSLSTRAGSRAATPREYTEPVMRILAFTIAFAAALHAQPAYDLLIKGGHVIDAKNRVDAVRDVAIAGGKIARVAERIDPAQAKQVVDATGLYVTPGLIDIHVHLYDPPRTRNHKVDPDAFSFRSGVTTMVDAGSSGWKDFA